MAETSAMTDFDLMSPFISLIPLSEDAAHAMKCSTNHSILYHNPDPEENGHPYIACFPLFDLYGKTHLTFGTSRAAHFTVPHMPDIASFHFTIHFDLSSFRLLLTQRAAPELVCQRPENGSRIPPTQHQIQLPRSAEVIFGEAGRFRFLLHVNHSVWQKTSAFKKAFREYQKSLRVSVCSTPIRKKRRGSSLDLEVPQKIKQPRFDPINAESMRRPSAVDCRG